MIDISTGDRRKLNVVIAYDSVAAGQRAMHSLSFLERKIGDGMNVDPRLWGFEFLEDSGMRDQAEVDGSEADMLIVSAGGESDLPATVKSWVTKCLAQRFGNGAVVALLGTTDNFDRPDSARFQFLQSAAIEAGIDFFAPQSS